MYSLPLEEIMRDYRPGSCNPTDYEWTWEVEAADLLAAICFCCGQPGHYQLQMEDHFRKVGRIDQPILLGGDLRIWDGHHRIVAAKRLGFTHLNIEEDDD